MVYIYIDLLIYMYIHIYRHQLRSPFAGFGLNFMGGVFVVSESGPIPHSQGHPHISQRGLINMGLALPNLVVEFACDKHCVCDWQAGR